MSKLQLSVTKIIENEYEDQPRQLRLTNTMDKIFKDFVKVFVAEDEKMQKLTREENEHTRNLLNELILIIKDISIQSIASPLRTSTIIVCKMGQCSNDTLKLLKETLSCTNGNKTKEKYEKQRNPYKPNGTKNTNCVTNCFGNFTIIKDLNKYILWS